MENSADGKRHNKHIFPTEELSTRFINNRIVKLMIYGVTSCVVFDREEKHVIIAQTQGAAGLSFNARLHSFLPGTHRLDSPGGYVRQDQHFDVDAILANRHRSSHAGCI